MPLLTSAEITKMRATVASTLDVAAWVIMRPEEQPSDLVGGRATVYVAAGTIDGRMLDSGKSSENVTADQIGGVAPFNFRSTFDADIQSQDRLTNGSETFEVVTPNTGRTANLGIYCGCKRVT